MDANKIYLSTYYFWTHLNNQKSLWVVSHPSQWDDRSRWRCWRCWWSWWSWCWWFWWYWWRQGRDQTRVEWKGFQLASNVQHAMRWSPSASGASRCIQALCKGQVFVCPHSLVVHQDFPTPSRHWVGSFVSSGMVRCWRCQRSRRQADYVPVEFRWILPNFQIRWKISQLPLGQGGRARGQRSQEKPPKLRGVSEIIESCQNVGTGATWQLCFRCWDLFVLMSASQLIFLSEYYIKYLPSWWCGRMCHVRSFPTLTCGILRSPQEVANMDTDDIATASANLWSRLIICPAVFKQGQRSICFLSKTYLQIWHGVQGRGSVNQSVRHYGSLQN